MNILTQSGPFVAIPINLLRQMGPDLACLVCYLVNRIQLAGGPVSITLQALSRDLNISERSLKRLIAQLSQIGLNVTRSGFPPVNTFSLDIAVLEGILSNWAKMAPMEPQLGQNGPNGSEGRKQRVGQSPSNGAKMAQLQDMRVEQALPNGAKMAQLESAEITGQETRPGLPPLVAEISPPLKELKEKELKEKEKDGGVSIGDLLIGPRLAETDTPQKRQIEIQQAAPVIAPPWYDRPDNITAGIKAEDELSTLPGIGALLVAVKRATGAKDNHWRSWLQYVVMPYWKTLGDAFPARLADALRLALSKDPRYQMQDVVAALSGQLPLSRATMPVESPGSPGPVSNVEAVSTGRGMALITEILDSLEDDVH